MVGVAATLLALIPPQAHADRRVCLKFEERTTLAGTLELVCTQYRTVKESSSQPPGSRGDEGGGEAPGNPSQSDDEADQAAAAAVEAARKAAAARAAKYRAELAKYRASVAQFQSCTSGSTTNFSTCSGRLLPPPAPLQEPIQTADQPAQGAAPQQPAQAQAPVVVLTTEEVAYMAVAQLTLRAPKVGIGPPPEINEWDMAAVGYPLWLWADGETGPVSSSQSVGGLTVGLSASVDRIVFDMGDGERVSCNGSGKRWTRAVTPGAESPSCGYRYEDPSLPKGNYTVNMTTFWSVRWNLNGDTGVISYPQTSSTTLPVGELQVLVR